MSPRLPIVLLLVGTPLLAGGCAGSMEATEFTNPRFNFGFVQRVAVLPFENLSNDRQAGLRATRLTVTELLATGAVDVVEPGEVQAALVKALGATAGRTVNPNKEQILALGTALEVQGVVMGSVTQSENLRSGTVPIPVVTLDMRMVETETGAIVWAVTQSEKGATMSARILGTGGEPLAETTRECVRKALASLIE